MAYCTQCGIPNRAGARFCRSCGAPMELIEDVRSTLPGVNVDLPEAGSPEPGQPPAPPGEAEAAESSGPQSEGQPEAAEPASPQLEEPVAGLPAPGKAGPERVETGSISEEPAEPFSTAEADGGAAQPAPQPVEAAPGLASGALVGGRYRIRGLSGTREDGSRVYEAEDLQACWSCGSVQPQPGLHYCETCGAVLSQWPVVSLVESQPGDLIAAPGPFTILESDRAYQVEAARVESKPQETGFVRVVAGQQTNSGSVRDINEDSLVVMQLTAICENQPAPQIQFFAVADGIGGSDAGEIASRTAVRAMVDALFRLVVQPVLSGETLLLESLPEHLREVARCANQKILEKRKEGAQDMGCTLAALLLYGSDGVVANVGDSRTYLFRDGKLAQVSTDHSVVANLVAGGLIRPEEVYTHDQRNVILRSLGDKPEVEVDTFPVKAQPGDRFLLCCDGLWEMVRGPMIEDVLLEQTDPQAACNRLVQFANQAGGDDNISVILVDIHPF